MRVSLLTRLFFSCSTLLFLFAPTSAGITFEEAAKLLPNKVGDATARGTATVPQHVFLDPINQEFFTGVRSALRSYVSPAGGKFRVQLFKTQSDSEAYAFLTRIRLAQASLPSTAKLDGVGTAAINLPARIVFSKGAVVVSINNDPAQDSNNSSLAGFARSFAATLDEGTSELPVLVKHLPDWETAQERAVYAVTQSALKELASNQPVLDVVSFDGGTEAVAATYEQGARLVIVEYATPQFAFDGDAAITARIAGLRGEGQPVPSAYRRVGNYAVFVFNAPNEAAATNLIDKVKYEKDVRWLGENPYAIERHNRAWLNMSTSIIINTVKATGAAIVICLTIGGIFGGAIFMRRRAQAAHTEKFSDAGGMMRLNLDEMNVKSNAARLIGQGNKVR